MKYLLIINPKSGNRLQKTYEHRVRHYFEWYGIKTEVRYSEYPGHSTIIARESLNQGFDVIIGCGGDGTINEVVNGLACSEQKMGIIPWGTGNVFAREMNFPLSLKKICKMIRKGRSVRIDLGKAEDRYFLLMYSSGFDAYALKHVERKGIKKIFGVFAYIIGAVKGFVRYRFPEINVEFEDNTTMTASMVVVSNTSRYGRYFKFSPTAIPVDGVLDLFIYKERGRWSLIKLFMRLLINSITGNHRNTHYFFLKQHSYFKVRSIKISSVDTKYYSQLDGDLFNKQSVRISVEPKGVDMILPRSIIKMFSKKLLFK